MKAFQDYYPDEYAHCYGCGRNNAQGHQLRSYWDGDVTVAHFTPKPEHISMPGFVYGGVIASLIDCHGVGSAAAFASREQGGDMDDNPELRYVTGKLDVDFLAPTPLGPELELRARLLELAPKRVNVEVSLSAAGQLCAKGLVIAVRLPPSMA
ncbi:MAG: PaaI family thioesterase [Cellvibrionaceae bacterium]|nr:PaaI family thioesterase [Cellvibrionaceae bacterium]MCV6626419.1 PaaI family thioesterase [Cellvibrionaceae bacterium]